MNFLEAVKASGGKNGTYEVGIITEDIPGVDGYEEDNLVIFQRENYGRNGDTLTVATPYCPRVPRNSISENVPVLSYNAIVNVPSRYVKKAKDLISLL